MLCSIAMSTMSKWKSKWGFPKRTTGSCPCGFQFIMTWSKAVAAA